jgi:leucyl aminopeptidase
MAADLPIRLAVRLGCVENSVSGTAMRPSDVLTTRSGLTVEVGNTDAEGRLVLCDLLDEACGEDPALLVDCATLTGAARVALGPDLPAVFCNDDAVAEALHRFGNEVDDPVWRLPLWPGYNDWLKSPIADLNNVSSKPLAGAIVAALYLQRFVKPHIPWIHIDLYAWNDQTRPGRPEGGEAMAMRALFALARNAATLVPGPDRATVTKL